MRSRPIIIVLTLFVAGGSAWLLLRDSAPDASTDAPSRGESVRPGIRPPRPRAAPRSDEPSDRVPDRTSRIPPDPPDNDAPVYQPSANRTQDDNIQASALDVLARAQGARLAALASEKRLVIDSKVAASIQTRLSEATQVDDWRTTTLLIQILAVSPDEPARDVLASAVADTRVPLRPHVPISLLDWQRGRTVPELARSARTRLISQLDSGDRSGAAEWMRIVATHGRAEEIDWLVQLMDDPGTASGAVAALTSTANSYATSRVRELVLAGRIPSSRLVPFAEAAPEDAFSLVAFLLSPESTMTRARCRLATADLMSALAQSTSADTLARTRTLLLGLSPADLQVQAPVAVDRLRSKALDISTGFDPVIEKPITVLERATSATAVTDLIIAASVIRTAEVTWSDRAVSALDHAAAVVDDESARRELRSVAQLVRSRGSR